MEMGNVRANMTKWNMEKIKKTQELVAPSTFTNEGEGGRLKSGGLVESCLRKS